MQKIVFARLPSLATFIGIAGAVLAFALALLMLQRDGNPAFLLIWCAGAWGMTVYTRFSHRWLASFERMAAQGTTATCGNVRGKWNGEAIDVVFKDLPDERGTCGRLAA